MPKDYAGPRRQRIDRAPKPVTEALVSHQPDSGQVLQLAARHGGGYSGAMTEVEARANLELVNLAIDRAARLAGRGAQDVSLIAISKTHDGAAIRPLIASGQRRFGENRVQEAEAKWPELMAETAGIELHLVGQLQSNKADEAVALFDVIHSLDRPSLATALAKAQDKAGRRPALFIQVNIGDEPQKGGCAIGDLPSLATLAATLSLDVRGLMAVPPADCEPAPFFALLAKLNRDLGLTALSIGMSSDYETAIMLGATHVRVGSALFGSRA